MTGLDWLKNRKIAPLEPAVEGSIEREGTPEDKHRSNKAHVGGCENLNRKNTEYSETYREKLKAFFEQNPGVFHTIPQIVSKFNEDNKDKDNKLYPNQALRSHLSDLLATRFLEAKGEVGTKKRAFRHPL